MELVFTTVAVIGGLAFSLAVAIVVEELIFGKVLCACLPSARRNPKSQTSDKTPGCTRNPCGLEMVKLHRGRVEV